MEEEEENDFDKLFDFTVVNPLDNNVNYIGGSYEVIFFDVDDEPMGYTGWIPYDNAKRIASSFNNGRAIVQAASCLRNYGKPLSMKFQSCGHEQKAHYKHRTIIAPVNDTFTYYSVDEMEEENEEEEKDDESDFEES